MMHSRLRTPHSGRHDADTSASALRHASRENGRGLDANIRRPLEAHTGHDFGRIRVHDGPASAAAAHAHDANALTIGRDVYLGDPVASMAPRERNRLLAHEGIHAVQQGERRVEKTDDLPVSRPEDAAEREANGIAASPLAPATITRLSSPLIQRDLTKPQKAKEGEFKMDMKTVSVPAGECGMKGTIAFHAADAAPDSKNIRLRQTGRVQDATGKDWEFKGAEKERNKIRTKADTTKGIEAGWHIDVFTSTIQPRTKSTDAPVTPWYRDYAPNASQSQDGSKSGKTVKDASLWDFPSWNANATYSFETVAAAADTGHTYGSLKWGFKISDVAKGTISDERASAADTESATSAEALKIFNEFYKNPGSSKAPK
jgi:hypothetical protein